ncbi:uncharacterized protein EAE97_008703 [Botrytis byssoidea]|uniref:Uncharacterized protein n=1 Tax=Botrytis byssoidea TaxID=139641 RepID=A0A9P5IFR1_9HELO|nr:uncharacterized protein EAE97_008703 [Botrytis byssoidea]KAF7932936.1 hypothetical protein EAE97_008703 [Botrytis byssoidea]
MIGKEEEQIIPPLTDFNTHRVEHEMRHKSSLVKNLFEGETPSILIRTSSPDLTFFNSTEIDSVVGIIVLKPGHI